MLRLFLLEIGFSEIFYGFCSTLHLSFHIKIWGNFISYLHWDLGEYIGLNVKFLFIPRDCLFYLFDLMYIYHLRTMMQFFLDRKSNETELFCVISRYVRNHMLGWGYI